MPRRPTYFHDFVGQSDRIGHAKRLIDGAKAAGEPFPSSLFIGPSGSGKTLLARSFSKEFGSKCIEVHGHNNPAVLCSKLSELNTTDVLFIDEAHNLSAECQELLYPVIDEYRIAAWSSKGQGQPAANEGVEGKIQPCTIILATDQPGKLLQALRKRMSVYISLRPYNKAEMRAIIDRIAADRSLLLTPQAANAIAAASCGLPRKARHLLEQLALFLSEATRREITLEDIRKFLKSLGVDANGYDLDDRRYMKTLHQLGKASLESLSVSLRTDPAWIRSEIEPRLLTHGQVRIGPGGRELTEKGRKWIESHTQTKKKKPA